MQPKLSDETKDLILKVASAAGPENAALVKMLVESAYVDGAAEVRFRGDPGHWGAVCRGPSLTLAV